MRITALETPGHTPESICLVVADEEKSADSSSVKPWAVLTGDTLFLEMWVVRICLGDILLAQLAGMLYDSLHNKTSSDFGDDVLVYPAHGAGSLCGRNMRAEKVSTIGTERLTNYALQIKGREEFIEQLTCNLPARPEYFLRDAEINRAGAAALSELPPLSPLGPAEFEDPAGRRWNRAGCSSRRGVRRWSRARIGEHCVVWTVCLWAGALLGLDSRPVLIAESEAAMAEARMRLARIGLEDARGYLNGGVEAWEKAGLPLGELPQISVEDFEPTVCKADACACWTCAASGVGGRAHRGRFLVAAG